MSSEPRVEGGIHGSRNAYGIFAIVPVRDTTPDAAEIQTTIHRRLGPAARLRLAMEMSDAVRELAKAGIRSRHPEYTELEVAQALSRILYPERVPSP